MKILFYLLRGMGGGARNTRFLLKNYALMFPDDQIHVVTAFERDFEEIASLQNVRIHGVPITRHLEWTRWRMGIGGMRKYIDEIGPDIIWCVNAGIYFRPRVPLVLMMNNLYLIKPWQEALMHRTHHWLRLLLIRYFFRKTLKNASGVIVQTNMVKDGIVSLWPHEDAIDVIAKSIDDGENVADSPLLPEQERLFGTNSKKDCFTFLFVSNYYPHKNHRVLIDAMEILRKKNADIRVAMTVTPEDLTRIGGATARDLIDQGFIIPLGWVEKEQMKALYDRCDACVMPSVFECLSSAHIEAMAWRKPQVCADLPYARAVCKDAALYADPHDADAWANAMCRIRDDESLGSFLQDRGSEIIKTDFPETWSEMAGLIRKSFERCLRTGAENT